MGSTGNELADRFVRLIEQARRQGYSEKQVAELVKDEARRHGPAALVAAQDALNH